MPGLRRIRDSVHAAAHSFVNCYLPAAETETDDRTAGEFLCRRPRVESRSLVGRVSAEHFRNAVALHPLKKSTLKRALKNFFFSFAENSVLKPLYNSVLAALLLQAHRKVLNTAESFICAADFDHSIEEAVHETVYRRVLVAHSFLKGALVAVARYLQIGSPELRILDEF